MDSWGWVMDKRTGDIAALKVGDDVAWRRLDGRWDIVKVTGIKED